MDCMHFIIREVQTREAVYTQAATWARTFFGDDMFDVEMEVTPDGGQWVAGRPVSWMAEVTVRRWDTDE